MPEPTMTSLDAEPAALINALKRIDDLEFALIRAVNFIENNMPEDAKTIALAALRERWTPNREKQTV